MTTEERDPLPEEPAITWILIVGDRRARLLRGRPFGHRLSRLEEAAEIENPWRTLEGSNRTTPASQRAGERLLKQTEFRQRFAGEIGRWLRELAKEHGIQSLQLFAPPRLAVVLRREYPPALAPQVCEHRIDLGTVGLGRLQSHPEVQSLLHKTPLEERLTGVPQTASASTSRS